MWNTKGCISLRQRLLIYEKVSLKDIIILRVATSRNCIHAYFILVFKINTIEQFHHGYLSDYEVKDVILICRSHGFESCVGCWDFSWLILFWLITVELKSLDFKHLGLIGELVLINIIVMILILICYQHLFSFYHHVFLIILCW